MKIYLTLTMTVWSSNVFVFLNIKKKKKKRRRKGWGGVMRKKNKKNNTPLFL